MPDAYVIQIGGRTAGIVARDGLDLRFNFFAASHDFNALECRSFPDPLTAERAARHLAKYGSLPRRVREPDDPIQAGGPGVQTGLRAPEVGRRRPDDHTDRSGIVSG